MFSINFLTFMANHLKHRPSSLKLAPSCIFTITIIHTQYTYVTFANFKTRYKMVAWPDMYGGHVLCKLQVATVNSAPLHYR